MKLTPDVLQDEIILIKHHIGDITEALDQGEKDYALLGLKDIGESCDRLQKFLSGNSVEEIDRADPPVKESRREMRLSRDYTAV